MFWLPLALTHMLFLRSSLACVSGGSNYEPRWWPNVLTLAVGHVRVALAFAVGLVMFLLPLLLLSLVPVAVMLLPLCSTSII